MFFFHKVDRVKRWQLYNGVIKGPIKSTNTYICMYDSLYFSVFFCTYVRKIEIFNVEVLGWGYD